MKQKFEAMTYYQSHPETLSEEFSALPAEAQEEIEKTYGDGQHLYFIVAPELGRIKIGIARDPHKRLITLQTNCPTKLYIDFVCPHVGRMMERKLHEAFKDLRITGEWFEYHPDIKKHIQKMREASRISGLVWDLVQKRMIYLRD